MKGFWKALMYVPVAMGIAMAVGAMSVGLFWLLANA